MKVATVDYSYKDVYWKSLLPLMKEKYGMEEIKQPDQVILALKDCFSHFCDSFRAILLKNKDASFFIFVHDVHEDSCKIWAQQLKGPKLNIDQEEFSGVRRILKYILEQGCILDMKGHANFKSQIDDQLVSYTKHLDELLYVGLKAFEFSERIARVQIAPRSTSLRIENEEVVILTYPPFNSLFDYVAKDYHNHLGSVAVLNCVAQFREVLLTDLGVDYNLLGSFVGEQLSNPVYRFGTVPMEKVYGELINTFGYAEEFVGGFYSGLTLSRANVMSLEDSILSTQSINRYTFRPILQYIIDGEVHHLVGVQKWMEALTLLSSNCFPFAQFPEEWKAIPTIDKFIHGLRQTQDKILEDPAIELLKNSGAKFDRNIRHLKKINNQNIGLVQEGVGELDILFLNEEGCTVYLVECKNNRARFEFNNWKRDLANFREKYEQQLARKFKWLSTHLQDVLEHFEILYNCKIENKGMYKVAPVFLINAPTLYMYDSDYEVFTLHELEQYLSGAHVRHFFDGELNGRKFRVYRPFFKNADRAVADILNN